MDLIFATNNPHKLQEISALAGDKIIIRGLEESGFSGEIPEDFESLEENASQKAWYIYNKSGENCFADDTGLETEALNGEPGVFSARYSLIGDKVFHGMPVSEGNIRKLIEKLAGKENRRARFRTVISLIFEGKEYRFEGLVSGEILSEPRGIKGFGYDPVFRPDGYDLSFAEMNLDEKNNISHRARALKVMMDFLSDRILNQ